MPKLKTYEQNLIDIVRESCPSLEKDTDEEITELLNSPKRS